MAENPNGSNILEGNSMSLTRHKIVFVGDVSVGKTAIISRFIDNKFKDVYEPSIGVDFCSKNIRFKGKNVKLQIWDSAGQEKYKSLIPTYIRGASIIFIVYDINKRETFTSVPGWISFVKSIDNAIIVLCGNKIDLDRKVETSEGEKLATKEDLQFFEISAKTNFNAKKVFFSVIAELPIFEKFSGNKLKLISELEQENNDSRLDNTFNNTDNGSMGLNIKGRTNIEKPVAKCIC